ncbi:MAG: hypothetical protein J7L11_04790 [Thermoprotei archaeon]|nr:hypothetical protein [Thermoprotei archaeon]
MASIREGTVEGFKAKIVRMGDLIIGIPVEIGPRILYLAHKDDSDINLFGVIPEFAIDTPEGKWKIYGGHRLWVSPEAMPRSYSLDDKPVDVRIRGGEVIIEGNPEPENFIRKRITIRPRSDGNSVEVIHEIENIGRWPIEFACWAISLMKKDGFAIAPIKPKRVDERGLLPDRVITLWPYTDLKDERLILSTNYVFMRQDPKIRDPIKIGVKANPPWAAYWTSGYLFVKKIKYEEGATYPDFQSSIEIYTNNLFLELETLGPLRKIDPGEVNRHTEIWKVSKVGELEPSEEAIGRVKDVIE